MTSTLNYYVIFEILLINGHVVSGITNDLSFLFEFLYPFRHQYVQLLWGMRI